MKHIPAETKILDQDEMISLKPCSIR